jgi:hypothetical protein
MTNYRVIGSDGREYGPVSQEQIRTWISEGRMNAANLICPEGSLDWRPLGTVPVFGPFVAPAPLPAGRMSTYSNARQTNNWAVWGFVCGLLSLTLCSCCCLPIDVFGIVFSIIALVQISNNPQTQSGTTLAVLGLVLSVLSFVVGSVLSTVWFASGAGDEFMRDLEREFRSGVGFLLRLR